MISLESAYLNSVKKWKNIEKKMFEGSSKVYQYPYQISKDMNLILRSLKKSTKSERENLKTRVQYEFPAASPEKVASITFQRMSPKLVHDLKEKMNKNIDYYQQSHYDKEIAQLRRQENLEKLKATDTLLYGVDHGRTFKSNLNNVTYNSNNSIIRMKELSNNRDKTLYKADFIKTSQSPSSRLNTKKVFKTQLDGLGYLSRTGNSSLLDLNSHTSGRTISNVKISGGNEINSNNPWLKFEYIHPGKYTKLATEKDLKLEGDNRIEAWSCCINTNKDSQVII